MDPYQASRPSLHRADSLPQAFKCAADGQWHPADKFSLAQLNKWHRRKGYANDGVTPATIGLVCREHTSRPVKQEIKCHGPCDAWKDRKHFSKRQRNDPRAQCIACTNWSINFNGDEVPHPPPNSALTGREVLAQFSAVQDEVPIAEDSLTDVATSTTGDVGSASSGSVPRHHRDLIMEIDDFGTIDSGLIAGAVSMFPGPVWWNRGAALDETTGLDDRMTIGVSREALAVHNKVKEEGAWMSDFESGGRPVTPPKTQTSRLYEQSSFFPKAVNGTNTAEGNSADGKSGSTYHPFPDVKPVAASDKKWFKPDTRRVFYAPPTHAENPVDLTNLRITEDDDDFGDDDSD